MTKLIKKKSCRVATEKRADNRGCHNNKGEDIFCYSYNDVVRLHPINH